MPSGQTPLPATIERAAHLISGASALLVCAGAGMSADSGLPTFRNGGGLWTMTTKVGTRDVSFDEIAQPKWFHHRPEVAWGFYGWRAHQYAKAEPHVGYQILRRWSLKMPQRSFVYTSNVDGLFAKSGMGDQHIVECHGTIHLLQCRKQSCGSGLWPTADVAIVVNDELKVAEPPLPKCPRCGRVARPNILMFDDVSFLKTRRRQQLQEFERWLFGVETGTLVILEIGAGTTVPTVRRTAEDVARRMRAPIIRINRDDHAPMLRDDRLSIDMGAADALEAIDRVLDVQRLFD